MKDILTTQEIEELKESLPIILNQIEDEIDWQESMGLYQKHHPALKKARKHLLKLITIINQL